jgi:hypothetical protein
MIGILQTEVKPEVIQFVNDTNKRIDEGGISKSPFIGELRLYEHTNKYFIYFDVKSLYPNIGSYIIAILIASIYFFHLSIWFGLIAIPFLFMMLFHTNFFFTYVMKKGLRKAGYIDDCLLVEQPLLVAMEMLENVSRRCA